MQPCNKPFIDAHDATPDEDNPEDATNAIIVAGDTGNAATVGIAAPPCVTTLQQQVRALSERNAQLQSMLAAALRDATTASTSAYHDELTGLPNRRLMKDRFQQAVAQADRQKTLVAVLLIDLDGFKEINDTYGHLAGDELLCKVASHLTATLRKTDTVCRYGGDEFLVILPNLSRAWEAMETIKKVQSRLDAEYDICGHHIPGAASIGYAIYPTDAGDYLDLIDKADAHMYRSKAERKRRDMAADMVDAPSPIHNAIIENSRRKEKNLNINIAPKPHVGAAND